MEIEQIRKALERELGDKWRIEDGGSDSIFCIRSNTYPFSIDIELHMWEEHMLNTGLAAIGRALQSAAGETMIPLADAVRVVEEFFWPDDRTGQRAIAALQALGGGDEYN